MTQAEGPTTAPAPLGRPHAHWRRTDSTNERAKDLAHAGATHGTLVTADEQSGGRGRQGRRWEAGPATALLMSLVLRGLDERGATLPLAAAVAVCEAVESVAPVACRVKWPNDIWVERRKLAGILVEGRPQEGWAALGIGLNVSTRRFPAELEQIATSLSLAAPGAVADRGPLLAALLATLARRLPAPPTDVLAAWRTRDALLGERVRWDGGEGTAAGIDAEGALVVDTASGRQLLRAGEVHLERRPVSRRPHP